MATRLHHALKCAAWPAEAADFSPRSGGSSRERKGPRADGEGQAFLGAVLEAGADLFRNDFRGRGRKGLAVLVAHFQAEEDRLADVLQRLVQRVALGDAAGQGGADDGVAAVGFRREDDGLAEPAVIPSASLCVNLAGQNLLLELPDHHQLSGGSLHDLVRTGALAK